MSLCQQNVQPCGTPGNPAYTALTPPVQMFKDDLPLPPVITPTANRLEMEMRPAVAELHSDIGPITPVWIYREKGSAAHKAEVPLGPTIVVQRGSPVRIDWINALKKKDGSFSPHPVVAATDMPEYVSYGNNLVAGTKSGPDHQAPENLFGLTAAEHDHTVGHIPPWTVVHLHGGRTAADSDGWPENGSYPGQTQLAAYENAQPGTMLWYHDHAMAITRLNVFAGLAGIYLIRDKREAELHLPTHGTSDTERHEIPLVIQDRALTCPGDHEGKIPGGLLLHKTGIDTTNGQKKPVDPDTGKEVALAPMEFFGPGILVNGKLWPKHKVDAGVVRLRLLNGSNARTYRLYFTDKEGTPRTVPMQQIGSDGGLLHKPVNINGQKGIPKSDEGVLTLAPAERIDLLVDFSAFANQSLELRNKAKAPYGILPPEYCSTGETPDTGEIDPANADDCYSKFVPFPQVMQFNIGKGSTVHRFVPEGTVMLSSAKPWSLQDVDPDGKLVKKARRVALVEESGMLLLREMQPATSTAPTMPGNDILCLDVGGNTEYYELLPSGFRDTVRIDPVDGDLEIWKLYNLSGDTHPFHIHLVQFKLLHRQGLADVPNPNPNDANPPPSPLIYTTKHTAPIADLHPGETGWKDTIRVNPREIVTLAVPFKAYRDSDTKPEEGIRMGITGRYMYHCHILEHEDHEMMRPYVVLPPEVAGHMDHHMGHMH